MTALAIPAAAFVFFACLGMLSAAADRKLAARIQWRVGPPWWQSFADFAKLLAKETILPAGSQKFLFLAAPVFGLAGLTAVASMLAGIPFGVSGDVFTAVYCLVLPSLALVLGGASSGNILAAVGVGREMKLFLGYELPFIVALMVPVIRTGSIRLAEIVAWQQVHGATALSLSGAAALCVAVLALTGKLGAAPFDVSEAETELAAGIMIEYSGGLLALFKLMKWMLLSVGIALLAALFLNPAGNLFLAVVKYAAVLCAVTLIRSTNPRLRIDQALTFFWGWLFLAAAATAVLAFTGV